MPGWGRGPGIPSARTAFQSPGGRGEETRSRGFAPTAIDIAPFRGLPPSTCRFAGIRVQFKYGKTGRARNLGVLASWRENEDSRKDAKAQRKDAV